jgi:hypothetical protein
LDTEINVTDENYSAMKLLPGTQTIGKFISHFKQPEQKAHCLDYYLAQSKRIGSKLKNGKSFSLAQYGVLII